MLRYEYDEMQSVMENCKVVQKFKDGRCFAVTKEDGIVEADSFMGLVRFLRLDGRKKGKKYTGSLAGGRWVMINGSPVYIESKQGYIIAGGGGNIPARVASPDGANKFTVQDFKNAKVAKAHYKKHADDYGGKENYLKTGLELIQKPCGGDIVGHRRKDKTSIVRYNKSTNDFAIGVVGDKGGLVTLYKPEEGAAYYERIKELDLNGKV